MKKPKNPLENPIMCPSCRGEKRISGKTCTEYKGTGKVRGPYQKYR